MKKCSVFSLVCMLAVMLVCVKTGAQSYVSLWKEVRAAQEKDLPKTALETVDKIIEKARVEKASGELLKAILVRGNLQADIVPDSADAAIGMLEQSLLKETMPETQSLHHAVLGRLYAERRGENGAHDVQKAKEHYRLAMQSTEVLSKTAAEKYVPFVLVGDDSRYFHHDLLHVVARFVGRGLGMMCASDAECDSLGKAFYHDVILHYRKGCHREAAFFMMLDSVDALPNVLGRTQSGKRRTANINSSTTRSSFYEALIKEFGDLEVCVEAYIRLAEIGNEEKAYQWATEGVRRYGTCRRTEVLRNKLAMLTQPRLSIEFQQTNYFPGQQDSITVEAVNVTHAVLKFYDTGLGADNKLFRNLSKASAKDYMKTPKLTVPIDLRKGEAYEQIRQKLPVTIPEKGSYVVVLEGEGQSSDVVPCFVSGLHVMQMALSSSKTRIVVSDAREGKPVAGAKVVLRSERQNPGVKSTLTTNEKGEICVKVRNGEYLTAYASHSGDVSCPGLQISRGYRSGNSSERKTRHVPLYTDRAVYRPGQTVQVGGFIYEKKGDSTIVVTDSVTLKMLDANDKEVSQATVKSDNFGAFTASFRLPSSCLNGHFTISTKNGSCSFRVEEYKRPSFRVEFEEIKSAYALGENVLLKGIVRTYSGFPLSGACVAVAVKRRSARFFNHYANETLLRRDTLQTDAEGNFEMRVRLEADETEEHTFYMYDVEAVAISESGESETASCRLHAGVHSAFLSTTFPKRVCREEAERGTFLFELRNAASQPIKGTVALEILSGDKRSLERRFECNRPIGYDWLKELPSGEYELSAWVEGSQDSTLKIRSKFAWFSMNDTKPVGAEPLQVHHNAEIFGEKDVKIYVATPLKNACIRYDLFAADSLLESRVMSLSDEAFTLPLSYRKQYGDGICAVFSLVRDGRLHHRSVSIRKPEPDKQLKLRWTSFRDHLQVGQDETWTLQVLKNGKPIKASLLATLYDASLDKFSQLYWPFSLTFSRAIPQRHWQALYNYGNGLSIEKPLLLKSDKDWAFSQFDESLLGGYAMSDLFSLRKNAPRSMGKLAFSKAAMADGVALNTKEVVDEESAALPAPEAEETKGEDAEAEMREDFNETAFFMPMLATNEKGEAVLRFKLPQSLTQWNFKALAHTEKVDYGMLDTMVVASKDFMVQPDMPRFLRAGDRTELAVTLRNATEKQIAGDVFFELRDPASGRIVLSGKEAFTLNPKAMVVKRFPVAVTNDYPLLICRTSARSDDFSDGEQHYLPILDNVQEVTESVPLAVVGKGTKTTPISDLFGGDVRKVQKPRLTVEYTSNPVWLALEALPTMAAPMSNDAVSMATAYYATVLAAREARAHPEIARLASKWRSRDGVDSLYLLLERNADLKQTVLNETPWVDAADGERERLKHLGDLLDTETLSLRRQSYLDRLLSLQNPDGAWSWHKGMPGNFGMTVEVCETLAKLGALVTDAIQEETHKSMGLAQKYMDAIAHKEVEEMKQWQRKHRDTPVVGTMLLRYLNVCSLRGLPSTTDRDYLTGLLEKSARTYSMYDKALAACILGFAGKQAAARTTLQSLMEHTVQQEGMGRWFDTDRAQWSWSSYRIPTQVAALNALSMLAPGDSLKMEEMTRWLLQAKRTQTWDNPRASVDAVYYLFLKTPWLSETSAAPSMTLTFSNRKTTQLTAALDETSAQPLGYARHTLKNESIVGQPESLTILKQTDSPSFGNVHAQYLVPMNQLKTHASGIRLKTIYYVRRGEEWQAIGEGVGLKVGDLVRVRHEITAERDFDFVSLKDGRPACAEPVQSLSGYDYMSGTYREVGDASSSYFFNQLRKGHHVVETQWRLVRSGTFTGAAPSLQCAYAPEFNALSSQPAWVVSNP